MPTKDELKGYFDDKHPRLEAWQFKQLIDECYPTTSGVYWVIGTQANDSSNSALDALFLSVAGRAAVQGDELRFRTADRFYWCRKTSATAWAGNYSETTGFTNL